jgi:hypothetical protein
MEPEQQVENWSDGVLNIESTRVCDELGGTRIRYRISQCAKPPPGKYLKDVDLTRIKSNQGTTMETWTREQVVQEFEAWTWEIAHTTGIKEHAKSARVYVIEILAILYLANDLPSFRPIKGSVRHDVMLRYFGLVRDYMKPRVEPPQKQPDALELIERDMNSLSLVDQHH